MAEYKKMKVRAFIPFEYEVIIKKDGNIDLHNEVENRALTELEDATNIDTDLIVLEEAEISEEGIFDLSEIEWNKDNTIGFII